MSLLRRKYTWRPVFDRRDFPISLPKTAPPRFKYWDCGPIMNQGSEGICVGCASVHSVRFNSLPMAKLIVEQAKFIDEWPGENYEGTSVHAGAKVLVNMALITKYEWAKTIEQVAATILTRGPMILGVNWFEGMAKPVKGIARPTGKRLGGHAICLTGYNSQTNLFRFDNSWGTAYGEKGRGWISFTDLKSLIRPKSFEACYVS